MLFTADEWDEMAFILKNFDALARVNSCADEIFVDGTFHTSPTGWAQVLNVATIIDGNTVLLYVVLMTNRKKALYNLTLSRIAQDLKDYLSVKMIHTDYEEALMAAGEEAFTNARIVGCNFHYAQSLYRKLRKSGNTKLIRYIRIL